MFTFQYNWTMVGLKCINYEITHRKISKGVNKLFKYVYLYKSPIIHTNIKYLQYKEKNELLSRISKKDNHLFLDDLTKINEIICKYVFKLRKGLLCSCSKN